MTEVEINALRIIVVIVLIFTILAFLRKKNTNPSNIYKFIFGIVLINLILTIINPAYSFINMLSFDSIEHQSFFDTLNTPNNKLNIDYWSIRGQIGDVLSGHFTALAFIGLLASLHLQRESIKQMQESIEQNTDVIELQNRAINLQKVEIGKQTKEIEITKIYNQIEFYYTQLESKKQTVKFFNSYTNQYEYGFDKIFSNYIYKNFIEIQDLLKIISDYQFIFTQIEKIKDDDLRKTLLQYFKHSISFIDIKQVNHLFKLTKIHRKITLQSKFLPMQFKLMYTDIYEETDWRKVLSDNHFNDEDINELAKYLDKNKTSTFMDVIYGLSQIIEIKDDKLDEIFTFLKK